MSHSSRPSHNNLDLPHSIVNAAAKVSDYNMEEVQHPEQMKNTRAYFLKRLQDRKQNNDGSHEKSILNSVMEEGT